MQLGQDRFGNRYWIAGGNWARVLVHVDCPPSVDPRGGGRYTEALESEYALHPGKWFSVNSVYGLKQLLSFLLERDHTEGPLRFAIQKLVPLLLRTMKKTMAAQQMRQNRSRQSRAVISEEYVESAGLLGGLCPPNLPFMNPIWPDNPTGEGC